MNAKYIYNYYQKAPLQSTFHAIKGQKVKIHYLLKCYSSKHQNETGYPFAT